MMRENAIITKIDGDFAWATTQRKTACGQCSVKKGCGTSVIANWYDGKRADIRVLNSVEAKIGDDVVIGLNDDVLVKVSFIVYFLPLVSLFVFWLFGRLVSAEFSVVYSEGWQILSGLFGLAIGFVGTRQFSKSVEKDSRFQAVVLQKLDKPVSFCLPVKQTSV